MPNNNSLNFGHQELKHYLLAHGWNKHQDQVPGVAEQYKKDNKLVNLVVEPTLPSYRSYLLDTVKSLAVFEKEPYETLLDLIGKIDSYRFSITVDQGQIGYRIRLPDSVALRNSISTLVLASAHSSVTPIIVHPRLGKKEPLDFLGECYEDQTSKSSYVANFLIPRLDGPHIKGSAVVGMIRSALSGAKEVAGREILPASTEYGDLAQKGISSQFVEALASLKTVAAAQKIRFDLEGGPAVEFYPDELANLSDFYSEIIMPSTAVKTVTGRVIATSYQPERTISIEFEQGGVSKVTKVKISDEHYKAILMEEHRLVVSTNNLTNRPRVRVTGVLRTRSRGRLEMAEISALEILGA